MPTSERDTILSIKTGDADAYKRIFHDFYPRLVVFAIKYVRDRDTARDIVQDHFVKMYESRQKLEIKSSLKSYLYTSIRNRCINYINQKKMHDNHHAAIRRQTREQSPEYQTAMEQTELEFLIWKEVATLPDQCQRIFKLSREQGLKNKEIAARLNLSKRTVETQISRALRVLRKNLGSYLRIVF